MKRVSIFTVLVLVMGGFFTKPDQILGGNPLKKNVQFAPEDTTVNYCRLIRAAYFYGQKMSEKKAQLPAQDVSTFNEIWKEVFNVPLYQSGITADEFKGDGRFAEGKHGSFPPSVLYHKDNPDTYTLFHIAKEIGQIKSAAFATCPSCIESSIAKINELMKSSRLKNQFAQLWIGTQGNISSTKAITDFWQFLKCMSIDDRVNPKTQPMFVSLKPYIKCPDTTFIKCKDEIKPKVSVGWRHCEIGGKTDTLGPKLVKGIDNCPGTVYAIKYVAKDQCLKSDSCTQYFVIKNGEPTVKCPRDTVVTCIENLAQYKLKVETSCDLHWSVIPGTPKLISGKKNCPDALYEMTYMVQDSCGRETKCKQTINIQNDGPTIQCPPDVTVECSTDIKKGTPKYTYSCYKKAILTTTGPILVKGKADCPGAVYEIEYEVKDSCDRTASCVQKFTIKNKDPEITCPPNKEVLCEEDITTGPPTSFKVACELGYDIIISDPLLIHGTKDCTGAIYEVTYTIKDECGRTASCTQLFTILQPDLLIKCPPDRIVLCAKDIVAEKPNITSVCKHLYNTTNTAPVLVSGNADCPGAKYQITYEVSDDCGRVKTCVQNFVIKNPDPEMVCNSSVEEIDCYAQIPTDLPQAVVSCDVKYEIKVSGPTLVSGKDRCDGAKYEVKFTLKDDCGRTEVCTKQYILRIPEPEITCPPNKTSICAPQLLRDQPKVTTYCDLTYTVAQAVPVLIKGAHNCPGAEYKVTYTVTDACDRSASCDQIITIVSGPPAIQCPPDRVVDCKDDVEAEQATVMESCFKSSVTTSAPLLLNGKDNCPGAIYGITYTLIDSCGRKVECTQNFTLIGKGPEILCPKDTVVRSKADIKAGKLLVSQGCTSGYDVNTSAPSLISGIDGLAGAVYAITYTLEDDCGYKKSCVQRFTIIDIPDDGINTLCDCLKEYGRVSLDLVQNPDQTNRDIAALIKKYGCAQLKSWIQSGTVELWNAWSTAEILGSSTGIANDIARRGNINIVMQNLEKIDKAIEILEEAINGEPKETMKKIVEWGLTEGANTLAGSGTPALVFTSIKSLGDFAQYLNNEILILNIKTLANYADRDPLIFDPDHYLKEYAKIREIKPGDRVTWNDGHNTFRIAIYEYAQHRMNNVSLPPLPEVWHNQQNMNLLRTVTYTMLKEVCQYWCYKLQLKHSLNKLIHEQSLLLRFKAIVAYMKNYNCQGNEKPCTMANAEMKEINGKFECVCISGFKWDPTKTQCVPYKDCNLIANAIEVFTSGGYDCECKNGFEWNSARTACIASKPDCGNLYPNSEARIDPATGEYRCVCISGYEWNADRTACVEIKPDCSNLYPNSEAKWNGATSKYYCDCKQGYEWNTDRTACIQSKPDCNAIYPNSEAKIDPATNQYMCYCKQGFEWNSGRTACIQAKPDCNAYYPNSEAIWDAATNQYLCNCKQGFEWNSGRTACIQAKPDCNAYYPNSEAIWDAATNQYLCNCKQGFEWNSGRTACIQAKPDCNAYYPNSEAYWDAATNQYLCNCKQGFEWNSGRTACILAKPDCNAYYPNSEAYWDAATNQYLCNCKQGYQWNATRTACESLIPDCNLYYRNSVAVWDQASNQYLCNCPQGYVWNAARTECIASQLPDCPSFYKNSVALWDPVTSQYLCYCQQGFEWNAARTECVPLGNGNRDNPQVNPNQVKPGDCNIQYKSGANEPEQYNIDVKRTTGSLTFTFDTQTIKDRIHIYHGGAKVFDSGCVGTSGSQVLTLNGYSSIFTIVVDPLCDPTESNTAWSFTLGCPQ
ncbi:MAG: hypothetical protein IPN29_17390 [Saprospiraceae bacterium]|nr:hypothetical protein [Saprospiraceae bacterium]